MHMEPHIYTWAKPKPGFFFWNKCSRFQNFLNIIVLMVVFGIKSIQTGLIFENAENSKQLSLGKRIYDHAYTTDLRIKWHVNK